MTQSIELTTSKVMTFIHHRLIQLVLMLCIVFTPAYGQVQSTPEVASDTELEAVQQRALTSLMALRQADEIRWQELFKSRVELVEQLSHLLSDRDLEFVAKAKRQGELVNRVYESAFAEALRFGREPTVAHQMAIAAVKLMPNFLFKEEYERLRAQLVAAQRLVGFAVTELNVFAGETSTLGQLWLAMDSIATVDELGDRFQAVDLNRLSKALPYSILLPQFVDANGNVPSETCIALLNILGVDPVSFAEEDQQPLLLTHGFFSTASFARHDLTHRKSRVDVYSRARRKGEYAEIFAAESLLLISYWLGFDFYRPESEQRKHFFRRLTKSWYHLFHENPLLHGRVLAGVVLDESDFVHKARMVTGNKLGSNSPAIANLTVDVARMTGHLIRAGDRVSLSVLQSLQFCLSAAGDSDLYVGLLEAWSSRVGNSLKYNLVGEPVAVGAAEDMLPLVESAETSVDLLRSFYPHWQKLLASPDPTVTEIRLFFALYRKVVEQHIGHYPKVTVDYVLKALALREMQMLATVDQIHEINYAPFNEELEFLIEHYRRHIPTSDEERERFTRLQANLDSGDFTQRDFEELCHLVIGRDSDRLTMYFGRLEEKGGRGFLPVPRIEEQKRKAIGKTPLTLQIDIFALLKLVDIDPIGFQVGDVGNVELPARDYKRAGSYVSHDLDHGIESNQYVRDATHFETPFARMLWFVLIYLAIADDTIDDASVFAFNAAHELVYMLGRLNPPKNLGDLYAPFANSDFEGSFTTCIEFAQRFSIIRPASSLPEFIASVQSALKGSIEGGEYEFYFSPAALQESYFFHLMTYLDEQSLADSAEFESRDWLENIDGLSAYYSEIFRTIATGSRLTPMQQRDLGNLSAVVSALPIDIGSLVLEQIGLTSDDLADLRVGRRDLYAIAQIVSAKSSRATDLPTIRTGVDFSRISLKRVRLPRAVVAKPKVAR